MTKYTKKPIIVAVLVILLLVISVSAASASGDNYYTVRWGDTLFSVGRMFGVNPYMIADVNGLADPNCIYAGQVLYIPSYGYNDGYNQHPVYDGCDGYGCDGYNYDSNHHLVMRGETLTSIAYYYGVSPWAIANANHLYNLNCIYAGQVLYIPQGGGYGYGDGGYGRGDGGYGHGDGGYGHGPGYGPGNDQGPVVYY